MYISVDKYLNFFNVRHIIAAIHFNYNLNREVVKNPDGSEQHVVVYPKFKNGEATVRDVKVAANFCKCFIHVIIQYNDIRHL